LRLGQHSGDVNATTNFELNMAGFCFQ
jgi:hypothetical protein